MANDIGKSAFGIRLKKAKSIRAKAEKKAQRIEAGILGDLKKEKKKLLAQIEEIDSEITRIAGKIVSSGGDGTKTRKDSEPVIFEILKELGKASCLTLETHPKMKALYSPRPVSSQSAKLKSLVASKKLAKTGEFKKAVYAVKS